MLNDTLARSFEPYVIDRVRLSVPSNHDVNATFDKDELTIHVRGSEEYWGRIPVRAYRSANDFAERFSESLDNVLATIADMIRQRAKRWAFEVAPAEVAWE